MNQYFYENFEITELSYFEYKNLVKNLFTDDLFILNQIFENIIKRSVKDITNIDILDKVKILLFLRSLTLGEEVNIIVNEKNYKLNVNSILDKITINRGDIISDKIVFKKSNSFYVDDVLNEVMLCVQKILLDESEIDFSKLTVEQKEVIFNEISDSNLVNIVNNISNNLKEDNLKLFDIDLNLHNGEILYFLKNIFNTDLNSLYDLEYHLIRNLNLNTVDFQNYSLSEMKILLNRLKEEFKDENKHSDSGVPIN